MLTYINSLNLAAVSMETVLHWSSDSPPFVLMNLMVHLRWSMCWTNVVYIENISCFGSCLGDKLEEWGRGMPGKLCICSFFCLYFLICTYILPLRHSCCNFLPALSLFIFFLPVRIMLDKVKGPMGAIRNLEAIILSSPSSLVSPHSICCRLC